MATALAKSRSPADMSEMFAQLSTHLRELGLSMSVWDSHARPVGRFQPCHQLCQFIHGADGLCAAAAGDLAGRIVSESRPGKSPAPCCLVGVPVHQRRRLVGAVVACYLPREMLQDESFARLCDRLQLDRQTVIASAGDACRHGEAEADDFMRILGWMLTREQALQTAQEELGNLSANLSSTYEELSLLYAISGAMSVMHQPQEFLRQVCSQLVEVMSVSAAAGVINARQAGPAEVLVAGKIALDPGQIGALVAQHIIPRVRDSRPVLDNDFQVQDHGLKAIRNFVAAPLAAEGNSVGILVAFNKRSGDFDSVDSKLIGSIGNQAAVFLEYIRLYADTKDLLMGVLHALTASIDAKDPYTRGHSQRVAMISKRLAEECGLSADKVQRIYLAGLLHDVGKIGVSEAVLRKPGRLTGEEYASVKRHPAIGAGILGDIRQLEDVVVGILTHHERPDGKGYPRGLTGEEVPLEGRIIGLADCLDAMTSHRTYRAALSLEKVVEEIRRNAGTQLDAALVEKLLSINLGEFMEELGRADDGAGCLTSGEEDVK
jgi:HD-GYP domain-containing protein (c-di-GMP phosphodiesterase class II)